MEHIWSVVCQEGILNQNTQNVSLIECLERIIFYLEDQRKVDGFPTSVTVVSAWWRSDMEKPERADARIIIKDPRGTVISKHPYVYEINLEDSTKLRGFVRFNGFPFTINGIYRIVVQAQINSKWKQFAAIPLEIIRSETDPDETVAP